MIAIVTAPPSDPAKIAFFRVRRWADGALYNVPVEAGQMGDGPLGLAAGRIDVDDRRRTDAAPGAIIASISPRFLLNLYIHQ